MDKVQRIMQKGTTVPNPGAITIGDDVDIERICGKGVALYPGTTIRGQNTFIAEGARIASEGPVTIENCYVGPEVELKGGFFNGAVFLKKACCGLGSHVRQGTILEEEASMAHTVGIKQTILFPFVTLGSLINFCDCLMAGGTDRKNHSEVGSSYIHFNFTPNQDKATPSLMGDVARGVMLNQPPIFLGGQGGLVGPSRIAFGTILAAGTICRNDQLKENHLVFGVKDRSGSIPYSPGGYYGLKRIIRNNFNYIGNLYALRQWYKHIRALFVGTELPPPLLEGLTITLSLGIKERIKQLYLLSQKLDSASAIEGLHKELPSQWSKIDAVLNGMQSHEGSAEFKELFIKIIEQQIQAKGKTYLGVIQGLDAQMSAVGTQWLESIVQRILAEIVNCLPSLGETNKAQS